MWGVIGGDQGRRRGGRGVEHGDSHSSRHQKTEIKSHVSQPHSTTDDQQPGTGTWGTVQTRPASSSSSGMCVTEEDKGVLGKNGVRVNRNPPTGQAVQHNKPVCALEVGGEQPTIQASVW